MGNYISYVTNTNIKTVKGQVHYRQKLTHRDNEAYKQVLSVKQLEKVKEFTTAFVQTPARKISRQNELSYWLNRTLALD
jgi:hypothetical protein